MAKSYKSLRTQPTPTEMLVQLLRLNGVRVLRAPGNRYSLRMGGKGSWRTELLTYVELRRRFGPGTAAHDILLRHPRANTIAKAPVREVSLA